MINRFLPFYFPIYILSTFKLLASVQPVLRKARNCFIVSADTKKGWHDEKVAIVNTKLLARHVSWQNFCRVDLSDRLVCWQIHYCEQCLKVSAVILVISLLAIKLEWFDMGIVYYPTGGWWRVLLLHRYTWLSVGSEVVRIDLLRFLTGCHKRRLNQALSVLSLSLGFFWCIYVVLLTRDSFMLCYRYVICVFCLLAVLVMLSVPVQVIDWKDSSLKWPIMCWWGR